MLQFEEIFELVKSVCKDEPVADHNSTPHAITIQTADVKKVCSLLHTHPTAYFDMLSCITAIDNGAAMGTIDVVYTLYSIPFNHSVCLKLALSREEPEVNTVSDVWKTANWHEREAFDLLGVKFIGHPDLRRILLPADWDGFPLRKDYQHQERYRNIKVSY
jgi:NADH-quinone oxidoreductase subunit C